MKYAKLYKFRVNDSPGIIRMVATNIDSAESGLRAMYHISLNHLLNLVGIDKMIDTESRYKHIKI